MHLSLDEQMMQSLSAQVVSIDFTPSLATLVMPVDGVKYETLSITTNEASQVIHARALKHQESYNDLFEDNKWLGERIKVLTGQVTTLSSSVCI